MKYLPPDKNNNFENEDEADTVYWEGKPRYVSDQTAFMRWSTEIEKDDNNIIDKKFLSDNRHRVIDINKFLPLSFIENPQSCKLFRLRRINIGFAVEAGLFELADETVLDNLADYNTTRGIRGNYQNALITQRREWKETGEPKKPGLLERIVHGKDKEQTREIAWEE